LEAIDAHYLTYECEPFMERNKQSIPKHSSLLKRELGKKTTTSMHPNVLE
jgi:hypothetical protein